jgi:hypothetical protein
MYAWCKPICTPTSTIKQVTRKRVRNGKLSVTTSFRFNTRSVLKSFYPGWYTKEAGDSKAVKKLPPNIAEIFTPLFITVWFAGDGTTAKDYRGSRFEVTSITPEERNVLKNLFYQKYGPCSALYSWGPLTQLT